MALGSLVHYQASRQGNAKRCSLFLFFSFSFLFISFLFFSFPFLSFPFLLFPFLATGADLEAGHEGAGLVLPPPAGSAALGQDGSDGVLLHRQLSSFCLLQHLAQRVHCTHTALVFSGFFWGFLIVLFSSVNENRTLVCGRLILCQKFSGSFGEHTVWGVDKTP